MKKTLTQKLLEIKQANDSAWEDYKNAIVSEVNALLKRCGDETGCNYNMILTAVTDAQKDNVRCDISEPVVSAFMIASKFTYIRKRWDKFIKANSEWRQLREAIKEING